MKYCPICGKTKSVMEWNPTMMRHHVACINCGCSVPAPPDDPTPEGARTAWDTRAEAALEE